MYYEKCLKCLSRWQRVPLLVRPEAAIGADSTPEEYSMTGQRALEPLDVIPPQCKSGLCKENVRMVLRRNRRTAHLFWGCRNFPDCRFTLAFQVDGCEVKGASAGLMIAALTSDDEG